jgi:hypothetical protein
VVAAISGILVFPFTILAHIKTCHGGERTIVWDIQNDRKPRTTIGAIDEGIPVATIRRVKELPLAIGTNTDIRRDGNEIPLVGLTFKDQEI